MIIIKAVSLIFPLFIGILSPAFAQEYNKWLFIKQESDFTDDKVYSVFNEDAQSAFAFRCKYFSDNDLYYMEIIYVADLHWRGEDASLFNQIDNLKIAIDGKKPFPIEFYRNRSNDFLSFDAGGPYFLFDKIRDVKSAFSIAAVIDGKIFYEKKYTIVGLWNAFASMPKRCIN